MQKSIMIKKLMRILTYPKKPFGVNFYLKYQKSTIKKQLVEKIIVV